MSGATKDDAAARDYEVVSTAAGYDRWAQVYDVEGNALIAVEEARLRGLVGPVSGLRVLDLGCGTGRHTLWLAAQGADVTGVEFSAGMLAAAHAKPGAERVHFIKHDVTERLPFAVGAFDRIVSALVLDHIANVGEFFAECRRVCAPGGFIVASTVHPAMHLRGVIAHFTDPATARDIAPASVQHQISDYVMASQGAGLRIEHLSEHSVDDEAVAQHPRAEKFRAWPIALLMKLVPTGANQP